MFERITAFLTSNGGFRKTKKEALNDERRLILAKYCPERRFNERYCKDSSYPWDISVSCEGHYEISAFIKHYDDILRAFNELDKKAALINEVENLK